MKIYKTSLFLCTLLFITGCVSNESIKPSLENKTFQRENVKLDKDKTNRKINQNKDLNKTIETKTKTSINESNNIQSKGYEQVPNFEQSYDLSLDIKQKVKHEEKIVLEGKKVKVSVESIPMNEFIDMMFSSVLSLNYTVSEEVRKIKKPVTLNMSKAQKKQEVFNVTKKLLALDGISIKKENGVIFIFKQSSNLVSSDMQNVYIGYGRNVPSSLSEVDTITMMVPFHYIEPSNGTYYLDLAGLKVTYSYPSTNLLSIRGDAKSVKKAIEVIKLVDKNNMREKTPYIIELNNIDVSIFESRIKEILSVSNIKVIDGRKKVGITITSIPEINSLYVLSPKKSWIDTIIYWKNKLDKPGQTGAEPRFYMYKVKNRKADELAKAINDVISMNTSNRKTKQSEEKKGSEEILALDPDIPTKVNVDLATNTLMMKILPSDYRKLLPLIEKLDALPLQVLTEITLMEVTLTDTFSLGFEYAIRNNDASFGLSDIKPLNFLLGGDGFAATYDSKTLDMTINAYAEDKLLNILSKPKLLILNNETGNINVGTQIPIVQSEATAADVGTTASIMRNISYRNTGVSVGLSPTINSNGVLTINTNIQLSEAQLNDTSSIDSPLVVNRGLSTSMIVKDGQSVLLGGLISTNISSNDGGVPLLKDIPLIGSMFTSESKKTVKTELIIMIKPNIIKSSESLEKESHRYLYMMKLLNDKKNLRIK